MRDTNNEIEKIGSPPKVYYRLCQEKTELNIEDINQEASGDYIILGMCETCHDGFHYGEDQFDLPTGFDNYTNIYFFQRQKICDMILRR